MTQEWTSPLEKELRPPAHLAGILELVGVEV